MVEFKRELKMNSCWNTSEFKGILRERLCSLLNGINKKSVLLCVDPALVGLLNKLVTFSYLTERTAVSKIVIIDNDAVTNIDSVRTQNDTSQIVVLTDVRTDLVLSDNLIKFCQQYSNEETIQLVYATWSTQVVNELSHLKHYIVSQLDEIVLTPWFMLPMTQFDDNVLIANVLYNQDDDNLYHPEKASLKETTRCVLLDNLVNALDSTLIETHTMINNCISMGRQSAKFVNLLKKKILVRSNPKSEFIKDGLFNNRYDSQLETDLIVLERDMDPISILLTQLTYSGILNDFYQFDKQGTKLLNNDGVIIDYANDDIWQEFKNLNFGTIGPKLNKMARELQNKYDVRHSAETVGEIKSFVNSLTSLQARQKLLQMHTTLSTDILKEVEQNNCLQFARIIELEQDILSETITSNEMFNRVLDLINENDVSESKLIKLICLISICKRHIKDHDLETLRNEMIDRFGIEAFFHVERLIQLQYLNDKTHMKDSLLKKDYRSVSSWLNTLPQENLNNEATFAFCGVVPLSMRLVQLVYDRTVLSKYYASQQPFIINKKPSISHTKELFQAIYGDSNIVQEHDLNGPDINKQDKLRLSKSSKPVTQVSIIVMIGGVTMGEIATLQFLQEQLHNKGIYKRFIILSDGIHRVDI